MAKNAEAIATRYTELACRFEEFSRRSVKAAHLAEDVGTTMVQAGHLLFEAIDADAFPESRKEANDAWWSREQGRIPGGTVAWYDTIQKAFNEQSLGESSSFKQDVVQQPSAQSAHGVWVHTIGWLATGFPGRMRHGAAGSNWTHIAKDEHGRPLGKDGMPLRGQWYRDDEPLHEDFIPPPPEQRAGLRWQLEGDCLYEHERFDDADHLHSQRVRAEASRDACSLLAELIEATAREIDESLDSRDFTIQAITTPLATKAASLCEVKPQTDWRDVKRRLLEMRDEGKTYTTIAKLAKVLSVSKSTVHKAIQHSPSLKGWQARHLESKSTPRAISLNEIVKDNIAQTREADPAEYVEADDVDTVFAKLIQEAQPEERSKLNSMDADQRRKIVTLVQNDPDRHDRILGRKP